MPAPDPRDRLRLWFGFFAAPAAWFIHLNVSYALGAWACREGLVWVLHGATALAVAIGGSGMLVALRAWRRWRAAEGAPPQSVRFLALGGAALSGFFLVIILVAGLINLMLDPCEASR